MDAKSQEQKDFSIPLYPYQLLDQNPAEKELGETPPPDRSSPGRSQTCGL